MAARRDHRISFDRVRTGATPWATATIGSIYEQGVLRRRRHAIGERRHSRPMTLVVPSRRTREALAVARCRGVRLGDPTRRGLERAGRGGAPLRAAIARSADRHAKDLAPVGRSPDARPLPAVGQPSTVIGAARRSMNPGGRTCDQVSMGGRALGTRDWRSGSWRANSCFRPRSSASCSACPASSR